MALSEMQPLLELADTDKRIQGFHQLHQYLQSQDDVTTHAILIDDLERLIPSIKASLKHANSFLSTAALTCLPDYFARFDNVTSDPHPSTSNSTSATSASLTNHLAHVLKHAFLNLLPLDKLADSKAQVRDLAKAAIVSAARTSLKLGVNAGTGPSKDKEGPWQLWEARMQELGFHSKSPKAREQVSTICVALYALSALRDPAHPPLAPLRPFTTFLLPLLSDPDPTVRTLALSTTIKIFASDLVTPAARADLKKAMIKLDVGKKTQETVLAAVLGGASAAAMERRSSGTSLGQPRPSAPSDGAKSDRSGSALSVASRSPSTSASKLPPGALRRPSGGPPTGAALAASLPSTAFPSDPSSVHAPPAEIPPVYMASDRDVLHEFEGMKVSFEGKETEFNWIERDKSVARIRGMIKGNAPRDYLESLLVGLKGVLEGIMKTASSLRTTVAVSALSLISELASALKHSLDIYFLDHLMAHCLTMAGGTKKLVATASQASVTSLITHIAYHHKMLQLLWLAMNDKIVSARNFAAAHVMMFVELHAVRSKHAIEHTNGLDELEKCVKKGLQDSSLVVKETMRKVFWKLKEIWPRLGDKILAGLDATTRKQLEKSDPSQATTTGAGAGTRSVSGPASGRAAGRPSIRDMVKQAKLAKEALADGDPVDALPVSSSPEAAKVQSTSLPSTPSAPAAAHASLNSVLASPPLVATTPPRFAPDHAPSSTGSRRHSRIPVHSPLGSPTHLPVDQGSRSPPSRRKIGSLDGSEATNKTFNIDEVVKAGNGSGSIPVTPAAVGKKGTKGSLVLPVPEPIVDDALRDQAFQAEQAAERLLELADEDEPQSQGERAASKDDKRIPHVPRQVDVFANSPDLRNGDGAVASGMNGARNWWMKKVDQSAIVPASVPSDTPDKIQEIDSLISSFTADQASTSDLLKLVQVSKDRPIVETDSNGGSPFSSPSHRPSASTSTSSSTFWTHRFTLIWEALSNQLSVPSTSEQATLTKEVLLVLFKSLVEHQLASFAGSEQDVFSTLLRLRSSDPTRSTIGAIEGIASCFCTTSEPLFSLSSLNQAMERFLSSASTPNTLDKSLGFSLGLRCLGTLFERLPPEVLDDVVPPSLPLIKKALEDPSGEVRRSSINALTSVFKVYRDENRLWDVVGDMPKDRKNLLTYYIAKLPPA
ncbi:BQ2448_4819 [Microbotryum intermedium]|uniref:BQ2448_4819 protein n=1 Tax=Microbotryum intermedium TaxID=269621 RepID=A0A238FG03_9BASI|nr:BQ2448_4819 [Microbotryum intermedium]